ncbi:hypothetical protein GTS_36830 [Gandjariella thermophila]|uniref:Right handed beta helix domain-containing protein n=2 Tax=Gandjariella thermophila TaxID=1931992 RepID=A0A4D4JAL4_9PSEU|nr:hypothetical protein GTS_36830 [Gandjariella thermophila]
MGACVLTVAASTGACTTAPPNLSGDGAPPSETANVSSCTSTVDDPKRTAQAMQNAAPGNTICFAGTGLADTDLTLTRSGTPAAPITLLGHGVPVRSVTVFGDNVVVDGFAVRGGTGLAVAGRAITVRHNTVRETTRNGISCDPCAGAAIESNTVDRADGTGILVNGQDVTVRDNMVSGSIMREMNDADGIRFFGRGHRITDNRIRDISMAGYPRPPHPDCFQTFDNSKPPTTDVVIARNTCENVGQHCLIATAETAGTHGEVGRSHSIRFVGNTCSVGASQAVLVRWFPDVEVSDNRISGPVFDRGVIYLDGSVNGAVLRNTFVGCYRQVEADDSSRAGLRVEGNVSVRPGTSPAALAPAAADVPCGR